MVKVNHFPITDTVLRSWHHSVTPVYSQDFTVPSVYGETGVVLLRCECGMEFSTGFPGVSNPDYVREEIHQVLTDHVNGIYSDGPKSAKGDMVVWLLGMGKTA